MANEIAATTGYRLARVAHLHRRRTEEALRKLGLHVGQEMVLLQLWEAEGPTQTDLAVRLGVESPTLTKMLARMEHAGWVRRQRDAADARRVHVHLTPAGRALEGPVRDAWLALDARAFAGLTEGEQADMRRLLGVVHDRLSP